MTNRFDDTEIKDCDVILTTKNSDQVKILLSQLVSSQVFTECNFDMTTSTYFNKHCDASILRQYRIESGHQSVDELATSMASDMRENHFETAGPGTGESEHEGTEEAKPQD